MPVPVPGRARLAAPGVLPVAAARAALSRAVASISAASSIASHPVGGAAHGAPRTRHSPRYCPRSPPGSSPGHGPTHPARSPCSAPLGFARAGSRPLPPPHLESAIKSRILSFGNTNYLITPRCRAYLSAQLARTIIKIRGPNYVSI